MPSKYDLSKIGPQHLERRAKIYVRQSTRQQIVDHPMSGLRQHDLVARAQELGWGAPQIDIIDQDQGHSSALGAPTRLGFERLLAAVGLSEVGAIFCIEAQRLARNDSAWSRLLELCRWTETLVIDSDNIYDLDRSDDQLILGLKSIMSSRELSWLFNRMIEAKRVKAGLGQLRLMLPTGFVHGVRGEIVRDPDAEVVAGIQQIFDLFDRLAGARTVARYLRDTHLQIPSTIRQAHAPHRIEWRTATTTRVLFILRNPIYAGAYVFGRYQSYRRVVDGRPALGIHYSLNPDEWGTLLRDHHEGYISWQKFLDNRQRLASNRNVASYTQRGIAREGPTLLQGFAFCGWCGHAMHISYHGNAPADAYYNCSVGKALDACPGQQTIRSRLVDDAVVQAFFEALQPAQLELTLAAINEVAGQRSRELKQLQAQLAYAGREADHAKRCLDAIDPAEIYAFQEATRLWNEKLKHRAALTQALALISQQETIAMDAVERQGILAAIQDLPALWHAPTTTDVERKQLIRFFVEDVVLRRDGQIIQITIRWQPGAWTRRDIPYTRRERRAPTKIVEGRVVRTRDYLNDPHIVDRVRVLSRDHLDKQIATCLNAEGFTKDTGGAFATYTIYRIRHKHDIAPCQEKKGTQADIIRQDGRYSARAAAKALHMSRDAVADLCRSGQLDGIQEGAHKSWWIRLTAAIIAERQARRAARWDVPPAVVSRIRELAPSHTDPQIAACLNAEGLFTNRGRLFTKPRVQWIRKQQGVPLGRLQEDEAIRQREDGRYSISAAAAILQVAPGTVARWCRDGILDGIQAGSYNQWWILLSAAVIAERSRCSTPAATVRQRIQELVAHTDKETAQQLNQEGLTTYHGRAFTVATVCQLRRKYQIRSSWAQTLQGGRVDAEHGRLYTATAAAQILQIHQRTVVSKCKAGQLNCRKDQLNNVWWVELAPEIIQAFRDRHTPLAE